MALRSGVQLFCLIGPTLPRPAPEALISAIDRVKVTHSDEGRSVFEIVLRAGRGTPYNRSDYPLMSGPLLKPFSRIRLVVRIGVVLKTLIDGIITHPQLSPADRPGDAVLTVTGEDLSVLMDIEEKIVAHPAMSEAMIATKIIARYARYGLTPMVSQPPVRVQPRPSEWVPIQRGADLAYLKEMAARFGFDFYIMPGPVPGVNIAYWGPPRRAGTPQPTLSANMGGATNLESISFDRDALGPELVSGLAVDRRTNKAVPLQTASTKRAPLARQSALRGQPKVRKVLPQNTAGLTAAAARAQAQAATDVSSDRTVTAEGALDVARYGTILEARRTVAVRGVGTTFDGFYYVKHVTSEIVPQQFVFRQSFKLEREGDGPLSPIVPV